METHLTHDLFPQVEVEVIRNTSGTPAHEAAEAARSASHVFRGDRQHVRGLLQHHLTRFGQMTAEEFKEDAQKAEGKLKQAEEVAEDKAGAALDLVKSLSRGSSSGSRASGEEEDWLSDQEDAAASSSPASRGSKLRAKPPRPVSGRKRSVRHTQRPTPRVMIEEPTSPRSDVSSPGGGSIRRGRTGESGTSPALPKHLRVQQDQHHGRAASPARSIRFSDQAGSGSPRSGTTTPRSPNDFVVAAPGGG